MASLTEQKDHFDYIGMVAALVLTMVWGFNYVAVKYANTGVAPVFACTIRSIVASLCGIVYCLVKREKLFHTDIMLFHGFMVGLLFGAGLGLHFRSLHLMLKKDSGSHDAVRGAR